jgi:hypothetical protein
MAVIVQGYLGVSDAEAVELSVLDLRWQMVLDNMGSEEPAFSQGTLQQFRQRLIAHDMDLRLLERTVELAKTTREFDWKKLPKDLRVAVDSRPLEGAGRVEDTINLLGQAARKLARCAARILGCDFDDICTEVDVPLLQGSSIKAALDINWNDPEQKDAALERLLEDVTALNEWLEREQLAIEEPLRPYIEAVAQVQKQDLERNEEGHMRIRRGVAEDRRVSIEDAEMRHGRKSKTKRFNGYKEHIATDVDTNLILACAVTPANRPEEEAAPDLLADLQRQAVSFGELLIDRAYVNSDLVEAVHAQRGTVLCKPWSARNRPNLFTKTDFKLNLRDNTITCPAGQVEHFEPGQTVHFDPEACGPCPLRAQCTNSASGRGRTVRIGEDERLQKRLRKLAASPTGRRRLRARTSVNLPPAGGHPG